MPHWTEDIKLNSIDMLPALQDASNILCNFFPQGRDSSILMQVESKREETKMVKVIL